VSGALVAGAVVAADFAVRPLERAHAHNDYRHARPLLDALDQGFCSVEADIHLVGGGLLVGHGAAELTPERTLERLYLEPLRERVRSNGGRVHRGGPEFSLLIDIKTGAEDTYRALEPRLRDYAEMLTEFRGDGVERRAVLVVISGNRPRELILGASVRYAAVDGRLADLDAPVSKEAMPWISESWATQFRWRGEGAFPESERQKLLLLVRLAHAQGRRVRFWAAPDNPAGWGELLRAGVDLINTDRLRELSEFLSLAAGAGPRE
jgi:hypothetical protein